MAVVTGETRGTRYFILFIGLEGYYFCTLPEALSCRRAVRIFLLLFYAIIDINTIIQTSLYIFFSNVRNELLMHERSDRLIQGQVIMVIFPQGG